MHQAAVRGFHVVVRAVTLCGYGARSTGPREYSQWSIRNVTPGMGDQGPKRI